MRIASIDIGTNTVLLLVADIGPTGYITPLRQEQRIPRLGKNVDAHGAISQSGIEAVAQILSEYAIIARDLQCEHIAACATSAVRDARNGSDLVSHILHSTGIHVDVLSGDEEARMTFAGALSGLPPVDGPVAVLDIGGGSTELSYRHTAHQNGNSQMERASMQMGAVRLTERFLADHPPTPEALRSAAVYVQEELAAVRNPGFSRYRLIAVAGTATTLACLDLNLREFDSSLVNGYLLPYERVNAWFARLAASRHEDIAAMSSATAGRADILTAGILILREVMQTLGFSAVEVSDRGLRFGYLLQRWKQVTSR